MAIRNWMRGSGEVMIPWVSTTDRRSGKEPCPLEGWEPTASLPGKYLAPPGD